MTELAGVGSRVGNLVGEERFVRKRVEVVVGIVGSFSVGENGGEGWAV